MRHPKIIGVAIVVAVTMAVSGYAATSVAQPYGGGGGWGCGYGSCWMGPGMMYGYGGGYGGPGWMGPGGMMYGYGGGYGPGWGQQTNLNLTVDQVKNNMQQWLARRGNPHVKLGNVAEKNADTITADIVTTDKGDLVDRFAVNRHTGYMQRE